MKKMTKTMKTMKTKTGRRKRRSLSIEKRKRNSWT
jgi:hypothetical protein